MVVFKFYIISNRVYIHKIVFNGMQFSPISSNGQFIFYLMLAHIALIHRKCQGRLMSTT